MLLVGDKQETQDLGLQPFYDVIQRVGEERGLMDPDSEEQVNYTRPFACGMGSHSTPLGR